MSLKICRGDIWYADLGEHTPSCGCEQRGVRPVLVIQNNVGNYFSPTVIIAPITDGKKQGMPTHVKLIPECGVNKNSTVLLEQIRTLDKSKLTERIGAVHKLLMIDVDEAIRISLGLEGGEENKCWQQKS